jgi:hypothetical protein
MSLEAESFSRDAIIPALVEIDVKFSGRYYTIEEISEINEYQWTNWKLISILDLNHIFGSRFSFK